MCEAKRTPYIETTRQNIRSVADRWSRSYPTSLYQVGNYRSILLRLEALDLETCGADEVDLIIGHPGWTRPTCDQCSVTCDAVVVVGAPEDDESATARLCLDCLKRVALILAGGDDAVRSEGS